MFGMITPTAPPPPNAFEAFKEMQAFYETAFGNLLTLFAIAVGVLLALAGLVGVLIPLWFDSQRKRKFELAETKIMGAIGDAQLQFGEDLKNATETLAKLERQFKEEFETMKAQGADEIARMDKRATERFHFLSGRIWQLQASTIAGNDSTRVHFCAASAKGYLKAGAPVLCKTMIEMSAYILATSEVNVLAEPGTRNPLDELLRELEQANENEKYRKEIDELRQAIATAEAKPSPEQSTPDED